MKFNKIFAVALAVLAMTSCDDNNAEDYPEFTGKVNTAAGVTVSLPSTFTANENEVPFNIPVTLSGQANGKVVVTVKAKETVQLPVDTEPAKEQEHYIFTSYTINIPAGETTGYFEVMPVWIQGEINDDRVFDLEIVAVQGATVSNDECLVTIANVDDAFTAMYGKWKFTAAACTNGVDLEYTLTIGGPDPSDEEYYGKELYAYGLRGLSYIFLPLNFEYNKETGERTISIQQGTLATTSLINFTGLGQCIVAGSESTSGFGADIPMVYTAAENGTETIAMQNMEQSWYLVVMPYPAMNEIYGHWGGWKGITLTR